VTKERQVTKAKQAILERLGKIARTRSDTGWHERPEYQAPQRANCVGKGTGEAKRTNKKDAPKGVLACSRSRLAERLAARPTGHAI
jgi:hypothetical protein